MRSSRKAFAARSEKGSALLAALCFAAVLAISLTSYLSVCYQTLKTSNRGVQSARTLNLAESGLEEALWALNEGDWTGWTIVSGTATKTTSGFAFDNGASGDSGQVQVTVTDYTGAAGTRTITSTATIAQGDGTSIARTLRIGSDSNPVTRSSPLFTRAIAAVNTVSVATGGAIIDSYDSTLGTYGSSGSPAGFAAVVAGNSVSLTANAQIKGYVTTVPTSSGAVNMTYASTSRLTGPSTLSTVKIDTTRQATTNTLPGTYGVETPTAYVNSSLAEIASGASYTFATSGAYKLRLTSGYHYVNGTLTVPSGVSVTLVVQGHLYFNTLGKIVVQSGGKLQIHVSGNAYIYYGGIENQGASPKDVVILGTHASTGSVIYVWSSTKFYGAIYAPKADITVWGYSSTSEYFGALVGNNVTINPYSTTNFKVHYDKSLRTADLSSLAIEAPSITIPEGGWSEVTP